MNLGAALGRLGERDSGTARWKRQSPPIAKPCKKIPVCAWPLEWAMTQMNLGNALQGWVSGETGTARLERPSPGLSRSLEGKNRAARRSNGMVQNNLGSALQFLGRGKEERHG